MIGIWGFAAVGRIVWFQDKTLFFQKGVGVLVPDFETLLLSQANWVYLFIGWPNKEWDSQGHQMDKVLFLSFMELHKTSL